MNEIELKIIKEKALEDHIPIIMDDTLEVIENKLKTILGSKINVKAKTNNKGKIEIEYFSKDELERQKTALQNANLRLAELQTQVKMLESLVQK